MNKKTVVDKRSVRLEDIMKKDYIPFLGGRPDREKVIRIDDVLDLKINLNLANTVEDFVKIM